MNEQEIFKALGEGETVYSETDKVQYRFIDGVLCFKYNGGLWKESDFVFKYKSREKVWKIVEKWYTNIPKTGILCKVADDSPEDLSMDHCEVICALDSTNEDFPFLTLGGTFFKYAEPVTLEEARELIYDPKK